MIGVMKWKSVSRKLSSDSLKSTVLSCSTCSVPLSPAGFWKTMSVSWNCLPFGTVSEGEHVVPLPVASGTAPVLVAAFASVAAAAAAPCPTIA